MGKGKPIYKINVALTDDAKRFSITWSDVEKNEEDKFEVNAPEIAPGPIYTKIPRKIEAHALDIGEKLFRFLDGDARYLEKALTIARQSGRLLELYLSICPQAADWPFELLAKEGTFLLPSNVHLIRSVSDWGEALEMIPQDRSMRMLFMACSAQDVKPELDFEKEEETIFRITQKLALDIEVEDSGSLEGLRERLELEQQEFDVVHLSGHADIDSEGRPYFIMEYDTGHHHDVFPEDLWDDALIENPPRMLFLSGCRTGEVLGTAEGAAVSFSRLLVEKFHIPVVLGWGRAVNDEEAIYAEKVIYKILSQGKSIIDAVQRARYELKKKFTTTLNPAWPLLRLFNGGVKPGALVKTGQKYTPKSRIIKHRFLKNSEVQILEEGFIGRRRQLQQSLRVLKHDQDKVGILLLGTGGLGKSCLAGKICERFSDHNLIIVHGKLNSITIRRSFKISFIEAQDEKGKELVNAGKEITEILENLCATSFKEKNYLILLDDFEQNLEGAARGEPNRLMPEAAEILKTLLYYLAFNVKMTQVLITSRYNFSLGDQHRDMIKEYLEPIILTSFGETEQRKKKQELQHILNYPDSAESRQLLESGCGNPRLMEWIDLLVGQMADDDVPKLLTAVKGKREEFIKTHVIRELLKKGGAELTRFLKWFSIYRRPVLIEGPGAVGQKAGLGNWKNQLDEGMRLSLIEYDAAHGSYRVTPLLREELLRDFDNNHAGHEAAFNYYKSLCENKTEEEFDAVLVEEWIYHAMGCGEEKTASRQGGQLIKHLRQQLAFRESKRVGLWILAEKEKKGRELDTTDDSFLLNEIGYTVNMMGEPCDAIGFYEEALKIDIAHYGPGHPDVAVDLNNLGSAWDAKGKHHKAIEYYEKALRIDVEHYGRKHQNIAIRLNNLGSVWSDLGEHHKAIGYYEEALQIWENVRGKEHPHTASALNNLGLELNFLGEHQKAVNYFNRALSIDEAYFGRKHLNVARDLNNLGVAYFASGQKEKARAYFQEAYTIKVNIFPPNHPSVMKTTKWLSDLDEEEL